MTKLTRDKVVVRLGAYNLTNIEEKGVVLRNVSNIIIHPDWNAFENSFDADIAILVLSETITFNYDIQPVCMPRDGIARNIEGVVVGWGIQENSSYAEIPKQTSIKAIDDSHCLRDDIGISEYTSARTFCGGNGDGTPNVGDSGGGFFVLSGSVWAQYGIVSAIRTSATGQLIPNALTVYTNLTQFKDYIVQTVSRTGGVMGEGNINIIMNCEYDFNDPFYGCWLYDIDIQRNNMEVVSFAGTHLYGETTRDVEMLHFMNGTMSFLPNGIGYLFDNIKHLTVGDTGDVNSGSMGTKLIRRSDFQNLENLSELRFLKNDIEMLNADSLWDLPNLQVFSLVENKLKVLYEETFIKNDKLKEVFMGSNQLNYLPGNMFQNNLMLEIVDFRNNYLTTIDEKIFEKTSRLVGVNFFSNQLEMLPRNLFNYKLSLKIVNFQNNTLSSIDEGLFETNVNLTAASFASNRLNSLPSNLFRNNLLLDIVDFRNNSLTTIDENLFEQNDLLKSVSFASNKLELIPVNFFKNNLNLQWIDFFNNTLKIIDIDIGLLKYIHFIDFRANHCVDLKYIENERSYDTKIYGTLEAFKNMIAGRCSSDNL